MVGLLTIIMYSVSLGFHAIVGEDSVDARTVAGMVAVVLSMGWITYDFVIQLRSACGGRKAAVPSLYRVVINQLVLTLNIGIVVGSVFKLFSESGWANPARSRSHDEFREHETAIIAVDSVSVACAAVFCICLCHLSQWPFPKQSRTALFMCGVTEFIIGVVIIVVNNIDTSDTKNFFLTLHRCSFYQSVGALMLALGLFAMGITFIYRETDRLSKVYGRLILFYLVLTACVSVPCLAFLITSTTYIVNSTMQQPYNFEVVQANTGLSSLSLVLLMAHSIAAKRLLRKPVTNLAVEVIDLNALSDTQCSAFARLIDRYGRPYAGAPGGENAMSLMKAYTRARVANMSCVVLRVYKPDHQPSIPVVEWPLRRNPRERAYEEIRAWRELDKEDILPYDDIDIEKEAGSIFTAATLTPTKPLSKNQIKKLKKKQEMHRRSVSKHDSIALPLDNASSEEEYRSQVELANMLMATEALVLLTRIENYDLTASVSGRFGQILSRTLGGSSPFKPLCMRLGLLAFHWPFRQSTFYTSPTRRPVARSAAILCAIAAWNKRLPRKERCSVLLDPRYENDSTERAICPSGWHPVRLPSSHIVDLRPHRSKTLAEYLKAIKYRNQSGAFDRAMGKVVESTGEFSEEECGLVMSLWSNIAKKRTSDGHTAVLTDPTKDLIKSLGETGDGMRSIMFLSVNAEIIASCVLFRLGDTITSDLQGLDHELARKYKAYFVMMQKTIEKALQEGVSFVDFGPTTSKPKLDIGCRSIPLMGGMKATGYFLDIVIKLAANQVNSG
ncbi:hypothetical protein TRVA0_022S00144 [Trichomonascus vanleenenianus]|uniref:uncharacterized protein n=1 Tax=Trichomonascus vanleenenianus TaxID=2268995 RepID=UPI003ECA00DC